MTHSKGLAEPVGFDRPTAAVPFLIAPGPAEPAALPPGPFDVPVQPVSQLPEPAAVLSAVQ